MNASKKSVLVDFQASEKSAINYWAALQNKVNVMYHLETKSTKSAAFPWLIYHRRDVQNLPADLSPEKIISEEISCFTDLKLTKKQLWNRLPFGSNETHLSTTNDTDAVSSLMEKSLLTIKELWPQALAEFEKLIRGIVWISSRKTYSLSDPKLFGIIFLNAEYYINRSYAELATDIVHESAHHTLFVETSIDKLIPEDYKKPIFSPLRLEYRPAIGSLHAAFSLARMLRWARILLGTHLEDLQNEGQRLHRLYAQGFVALVAALGELSWSKRGEILLQDLRDESDLVKSHLRQTESLR
jgi:hypothetical protein